MQQRSQQDRRTDSATAERFNLAILAARAFDLQAGRNYLMLSGIDSSLVQEFVARFPRQLRWTIPLHPIDRRRSRPALQATAQTEHSKSD